MVDGRSYAILGGYERLGCAITGLLVRNRAERVTVAGQDVDKAEAAVKGFALHPNGGAVAAQRIEAHDEDGLAKLLDEHELLIHTAPLKDNAPEALAVALKRTGGRAVLAGHDPNAVAGIRSQTTAMENAGATVVADAGADPGLPGLVGHLAAGAHGTADAVEIAARYRASEVGRAGLADILDGATDVEWIYEGRWCRASLFEVCKKILARRARRVARNAGPSARARCAAQPSRSKTANPQARRAERPRRPDLFLRRLMRRLLPRRIALATLEASMRHTNRPPYGLCL